MRDTCGLFREEAARNATGTASATMEPAPLAVKLDAADQSSEKASSATLLGKLDVLEGSQLFRACRKRLRVLH